MPLQLKMCSINRSVLYINHIRPHLIAASAAGLLAVSIVASTVQLAFLPEVDHIHQEFAAGTTHEARWVPQLVVASPLSIDSWLAQAHGLLAVMARLEGKEEKKRWLVWWWDLDFITDINT